MTTPRNPDLRIDPDYLRDRGRDFGTMSAAARVPPGLGAGGQFVHSAHPLMFPDTKALADTLAQTAQGTQQWVTGLGATLGFYRDFVTRAADVFQANDQQGAQDVGRSQRITAGLSGLTGQIPRDPRVPPATPGTD